MIASREQQAPSTWIKYTFWMQRLPPGVSAHIVNKRKLKQRRLSRSQGPAMLCISRLARTFVGLELPQSQLGHVRLSHMDLPAQIAHIICKNKCTPAGRSTEAVQIP